MSAGSDDATRRRLRWRCRRGVRELDQLCLRYLDRVWGGASPDERHTFERLLACEDDRLWRWFLGHEAPDDTELHALVERIRALPV